MPEGGVKLKNLTGFTTYMISVAPFNAAGDGPRSPPTRGRTQQAGMQIRTRPVNLTNLKKMQKQIFNEDMMQKERGKVHGMKTNEATARYD